MSLTLSHPQSDDIGPVDLPTRPVLSLRDRYLGRALEEISDLILLIGKMQRNPEQPNGQAVLAARRLLAALEQKPFQLGPSAP